MKKVNLFLIFLFIVIFIIIYDYNKVNINDLKEIEVQELFDERFNILENYLKYNIENKIIIFLNFPTCSNCYKKFISKNTEVLRKKYSILIINTNLTHSKIAEDLNEYLTYFNKVLILKNGYKMQKLIKKNVLVAITFKKNNELKIIKINPRYTS